MLWRHLKSSLWLIGLLGLSYSLQAAPLFPVLTGQVVDQAGVLSASTRLELESLLSTQLEATSNQVVVVTLNSLQGYEISDYGYQLGRHWGIGQQGRDNGVLLIIAPNERKVRIEVGYGLEGHLTDAISHNIIQTRILPLFRQGDFGQGAMAGAKAILEAIDGIYEPLDEPQSDWGPILMFLLIAVIFFLMTRHSERLYNNNPGRYGSSRRFPASGGYGGGIGGSGGFSGGGGGFGGGGASGGW